MEKEVLKVVEIMIKLWKRKRGPAQQLKVVEIMRKLWKPKRGHGSCGNYEEVLEAKNR